jgi:hypothetical protein
MSNEATITITETDDGVTVTIASENRTQDNAALIAALHMVQQFKSTCERGGIMGEVLATRPLDIN